MVENAAQAGRRKLALKYAFDKVLAALSLVVLSPFFAVIALAIVVESLVSPRARGPVIIADRRMTEGRPFVMLKFRTYFVEDDEAQAGKRGTTDFINDRDVTFVGGFLRRFYLDELPQLVNILKGDMSFVGPRPVPEDQYVATLEAGYRAKRVLRAGLGGPVQVLKGRWKRLGTYLDADEELIERYGRSSAVGVVGLDLKIMWRTFRKALEGDGMEDPNR